MKKILFLALATTIALSSFAQCDPAVVKVMPTVYFKTSRNITPAQDKYMSNVFTSVIEPALKNTKGLKGGWAAYDGSKQFAAGNNCTPDGLTTTTFESYLGLMGCSKNKTIAIRDETGLVIHFDLNSLHYISKMSENETYRNDKNVFLQNKVAGSQVYELKQKTQSDKYDYLTFYSQTDDAKYFLITKKEIPIFIPVTVKQGLELSIDNLNAEIEEANKKSGTSTILSKEAWLKKEGIQPFEGITAKQLQELNDARYQGYVEGSNGFIQGNNANIDSYKKIIGVIKEFLKKTPAKILDSPVYGSPLSYFSNVNEIRELLHIDDGLKTNSFVIINPAYLNTKLPKAAPQFICVELRAQSNDAVTGKAFTNFEDALDFNKLEQLLAK